ncbi:MAG: universal stress protein [Nitrospirota bacterium]
MYKKILAAVNEFTNSETAAHYALALAKACRAKLLLVFVSEETLRHAVFRHAEAAQERLFVEAERQGIEVERITETGGPVMRVQEIVKERGVDLVVIATRREDVKRRFFARTHAREFMTKLPCSVAMVRVVHMGRIHPRDILVPLKGHISHIDERAYFIAKLAEGLGSRVTLFHLLKPLTSFFQGERVLLPVERERRLPKDIERFVKAIEQYGIAHERRTGHGSIGRSITIEAALKRNDLIVMGASERSLLRSLISGNPVEAVLRETPCNLIIVRPDHEHRAGEQH